MNRFYSLRTAHKLVLGFGLCLALAVLVGSIAIVRMAEMNKVTENILSSSLAGIEALDAFQASARQVRTIEYRHALTFTPEQKTKGEAGLTKAEGESQKALQDYQKSLSSPADTQNFHELQTEWQQYAAMKGEFLVISRNNNIKACAVMLNGPMRDQFLHVTDTAQKMVDWNKKNGNDYARRVKSDYTSARTTIFGLLALFIILGSVVTWLITRYMVMTLTQVSSRLEMLDTVCITNLNAAVAALEQGDLTAEIVTGTKPHAPEKPGVGLRWLPMKCGSLRSAAQ